MKIPNILALIVACILSALSYGQTGGSITGSSDNIGNSDLNVSVPLRTLSSSATSNRFSFEDFGIIQYIREGAGLAENRYLNRTDLGAQQFIFDSYEFINSLNFQRVFVEHLQAADDLTDGSEDGQYQIRIMDNGTFPAGATFALRGTGQINVINGATLTVGGVWTDASDIRHKYSVQPLNYGLAEALKLNPVRYYLYSTNAPDIGLIAQEVEKVIPEVVTGEEGSKALAYQKLVPVLLNAIEELNQKIESLEAEVELLKNN